MIEFLQSRLESVALEDESKVFSDFDLNPSSQQNTIMLKPAAVLVPLVWRSGGWQVVFTLRSDQMPTHAGQVSFPGGRQQEQDTDLCHTALRECEEETGILQSQVKVLGRFENYHTVTNYQITPFVGVIKGEPLLRADPKEVAQIFEVPFSYLCQLANFRRESREWKGKKRFFYAIPWQEHYIWGATAGMLRALALRLQKSKNKRVQ